MAIDVGCVVWLLRRLICRMDKRGIIISSMAASVVGMG
jgi:hypothetical protein